jgi:hypothetical protein
LNNIFSEGQIKINKKLKCMYTFLMSELDDIELGKFVSTTMLIGRTYGFSKLKTFMDEFLIITT